MPPAAGAATPTELEAIADTVPMLRRLACFGKLSGRIAAVPDGYSADAEKLRAQFVLRPFKMTEVHKVGPEPTCGEDATVFASPAALPEVLALARTLPGLQNAVRSAAGVLRQVSSGARELEHIGGQAKEIISKADVFEQRWQALGAPQEVQDVPTNASKLGEGVRDRAAALAKAAVEMEKRMKALLGDTWDAFLFTTMAVATMAGSAP